MLGNKNCLAQKVSEDSTGAVHFNSRMQYSEKFQLYDHIVKLKYLIYLKGAVLL